MDKKFLSIESMQELLEIKGSREVWRIIEAIPNWQDRIANRQLFFMAGGSLEEN